ncbi:DUF4367 domain-containing protein [Anaerovorax odorimutans]|uniref:DUF4367 domain-containing protein n=1 Tax=Anaerovorax odorimutans TaxID=109327 RepID=UPI00040FE418|nr:DUF4367 domain-containing protein [Anaerovorax odorimutans]
MNKRISEILQGATENEPENVGFYKDLKYTKIDEEYIKKIIAGKKQSKKKNRNCFTRIIAIAAVVSAFFLMTNIMVIMVNNTPVSAVKGKLEQILLHKDDTLITEKDNLNLTEEGVEKEFLIEDWRDLDGAKKYCEGIYIPEYIPKRYEFNNLTIKKRDKSFYCIKYEFKSNNKEKLIINQYEYNDSKQVNLTISDYDEKMIIDDMTIYLSKDNFTNNLMAIYKADNNKIDISGNITKEELEKIILNLKN